MSNDAAPLSEGRSVPSSSSSSSQSSSPGAAEDNRALTRSPGLNVFRLNPFRVLRVPVTIPSNEAVWKSEKVLSRVRAGLDRPEPELAPWLPGVDEFDIREGAQKMEEPLRRLKEQLLWFDLENDPRGPTLERGLVDQDRAKLADYLATPASQATSTAHRANQANLRLLLALSWLHGVVLVDDTCAVARAGAGNASPPSLPWKTEGTLTAVSDPHRAFVVAKPGGAFPGADLTAGGWSALLGDALARWAALLKDPAFTTYVAAAIKALGDELVGEEDAESLTSAITIALTDLVVGETRLQMSTGRVDQVLELARVATESGIDPVYWTTAFRPLRAVFQAEVLELDGLLEADKSPNVHDVTLYLRRVKHLTRAWAAVKDDGVLGLDQTIDAAVTRAVDQLRALDHPAVIMEEIFEALTEAEGLARSASVKERAREFRGLLEKYREVLCHYCSKRGAKLESSVVLRAKKIVSREHVGYNTIRTTYSVTAGLVSRCETCAEVHEFMQYLTAAMWIAPAIAAPIVWWAGAQFLRGPVLWGAPIAIFLVAWLAKLLVAAIVTPKGERVYWSYGDAKGYRRLADEGYGITKRDYKKDAYGRLMAGGVTG